MLIDWLFVLEDWNVFIWILLFFNLILFVLLILGVILYEIKEVCFFLLELNGEIWINLWILCLDFKLL